MFRIFFLACVCSALSACVFYAPTYVSQPSTAVVHYESTSTVDSHEETVKQETIGRSERVVPKATSTRKQRTLAECEAFTLPRGVAPPYLTDKHIAAAKDGNEIDQLLGMKVKELQTYIDGMHSRLEQAHAKWLESCTQKLLD